MSFAQLEGVHIGVYTRDKMARKSPLYKVREAGLPTATKKVMLQWGEIASGASHFWNQIPPPKHCVTGAPFPDPPPRRPPPRVRGLERPPAPPPGKRVPNLPSELTWPFEGSGMAYTCVLNEIKG